MQVICFICLLTFTFRANAARRSVVEDFQQTSSQGCQGGSCSWAHIAARSGYGCTTCKKLTGGQAADTRKVVLTTPRGQNVDAVVKYAGPSQEIDSLKVEIKVAKALMTAGVAGVPHYFTDVVTDDGNPVLAMEFLQGYQDLDHFFPVLQTEDAFTRETRAAAMFRAYYEIYMAGVRHCDLHWGQVMFKVDDPTDAKFLDFGKSQSGRLPNDPGCVSMGQLPDIGTEGKLWDALYLGDKFGIKKPITGGGSSFQAGGASYSTFRAKFGCVACARGTRPTKDQQLSQINAYAQTIIDLWRENHGGMPKPPTGHQNVQNNFGFQPTKPTHQGGGHQFPMDFNTPSRDDHRGGNRQPMGFTEPTRDDHAHHAGSGLKTCSAPPAKVPSRAGSLCKLSNNDAKKGECEATVSCEDDSAPRKVTINAGYDVTSIRNCRNCKVGR